MFKVIHDIVAQSSGSMEEVCMCVRRRRGAALSRGRCPCPQEEAAPEDARRGSSSGGTGHAGSGRGNGVCGWHAHESPEEQTQEDMTVAVASRRGRRPCTSCVYLALCGCSTLLVYNK